MLPFDLSASNFFFAHRTPEIISSFSWITMLGDTWFVVGITICVVLVLFVRKQETFILPFLVTVVGSVLFTTVSKLVFHIDRPIDALFLEDTFAFPSGHATVAVALYGFIAYILFHTIQNYWLRRIVVALSLVVVLLVGLSRLYLGVHYLSDVYAGYLVGLLWLLFGMALTEWMFLHKRE